MTLEREYREAAEQLRAEAEELETVHKRPLQLLAEIGFPRAEPGLEALEDRVRVLRDGASRLNEEADREMRREEYGYAEAIADLREEIEELATVYRRRLELLAAAGVREAEQELEGLPGSIARLEEWARLLQEAAASSQAAEPESG